MMLPETDSMLELVFLEAILAISTQSKSLQIDLLRVVHNRKQMTLLVVCLERKVAFETTAFSRV